MRAIKCFSKKISRTISSGYRITMTLRRKHNLYSKRELEKKRNEHIAIGQKSQYLSYEYAHIMQS